MLKPKVNPAEYLRTIYTAKQCTDLNDVHIAFDSIRKLAWLVDFNYTPAMSRRLASLERREKQLQAN